MSATTSRQKAGLVIGGLISAASAPSVLSPTPEGEVGPPVQVLALDSVVGLVGLVAVVVAWRTGSRAAARVLAGVVALQALTAMPAFFVDVPALAKMMVGVLTLLSILAVALVLSPAPRPELAASPREA